MNIKKLTQELINAERVAIDTAWQSNFENSWDEIEKHQRMSADKREMYQESFKENIKNGSNSAETIPSVSYNAVEEGNDNVLTRRQKLALDSLTTDERISFLAVLGDDPANDINVKWQKVEKWINNLEALRREDNPPPDVHKDINRCLEVERRINSFILAKSSPNVTKSKSEDDSFDIASYVEEEFKQFIDRYYKAYDEDVARIKSEREDLKLKIQLQKEEKIRMDKSLEKIKKVDNDFPVNTVADVIQNSELNRPSFTPTPMPEQNLSPSKPSANGERVKKSRLKKRDIERSSPQLTPEQLTHTTKLVGNIKKYAKYLLQDVNKIERRYYKINGDNEIELTGSKTMKVTGDKYKTVQDYLKGNFADIKFASIEHITIESKSVAKNPDALQGVNVGKVTYAPSVIIKNIKHSSL